MIPGRRPFREALVVVGLTLSACGKNAPPPASHDASPEDDERVARLRSLGYLDTTGLEKARPGRGAQIIDQESAFSGYTLVVYAGTCTCELIREDGRLVRSWTDQPCHRWEHAELLPDGDLVVVGARLDEDAVPDPIECGRYLLRLSWDGRQVWRSEINAHHDVSLTPRGKLLTLVLSRRRIPEIDPDNDVADDVVTTLSPEGKVLESASLYDILAASKIPFTIRRIGGKAHGSSRLIDLFHTNAVRTASVPALAGKSPIYGRDTLLLTVRHQDELLVVDWSTRQLLWHWGRGVLSGPHEASMLDDGHVLVFDNGLSRGASRVLELDPLEPARMTQFAPGSQRFFSRVMGSCQRVPNGNTLIVNSEGGAAFELTPQGAPAWTFEGTQQTADGHRVKIIRMRKIPSAVVDAIVSRRGLPQR